jgi:RNA polymerase sigma-70 factor (ECF subfamily)
LPLKLTNDRLIFERTRVAGNPALFGATYFLGIKIRKLPSYHQAINEMFNKRRRHQKLTQDLCANRNRFYKLAYSWTSDPMLADDLVQESMQKAFMSFDSLKDDSKLNAWTCRIMLNCYRDWLRRQKDTVNVDDYEFADDQDPAGYFNQDDTSAMVRHCISKLNEKHRNVVTLVDLMELSYEEVAQALEIPIGTVMSRLCRARAQLRNLLEKQLRQPPLVQPVNLKRVK